MVPKGVGGITTYNMSSGKILPSKESQVAFRARR